ncbi:hypothetical protein JCM8097_007109 [Rhodosporidiobolus ruineniae]
MSSFKRKRSLCPSPEPPSASRAIQSSIALLSTHGNLPPTVFSRLLKSLSHAHAIAVEQEGDAAPKEEKKRVMKRLRFQTPERWDKEEDVDEKPDLGVGPSRAREDVKPLVGRADQAGEAVPAQAAPAPLPLPPLPRWSLAGVQGRLTPAEKAILKDIEEGFPLLDQLGILVRPLRLNEGKIDLLQWEVALSMPPDSNWARSLVRARLVFSPDYPRTPPLVQLPAAFFHPNVHFGGALAFSRSDARPVWGTDKYAELAEKYLPEPTEEEAAEEARTGRQKPWPAGLYPALPSSIRLPFYLAAAQQQFAFEDLRHFKNPEAYKLAKYHPAQYKETVHKLVLRMLPTRADLDDLIEARRRAKYRKATGKEPSMTGGA